MLLIIQILPIFQPCISAASSGLIISGRKVATTVPDTILWAEKGKNIHVSCLSPRKTFPRSLLADFPLTPHQQLIKKNKSQDFPGGSVIHSLFRSAGDVGSIPVWGTKIPCAIKQVSLHTATEDPVCHR